MEGSGDFLGQLERAIETRRVWLESTQIPQLKSSVHTFQSTFENLVGLLIRKGYLREDPYNYDKDITELAVPDDDPLPEFENTEEVSYRVAAYRRQLEFLVTYGQFTLVGLDLGQLKKIAGLLGYINWSDFAEVTRSPITRALARYANKIKLQGEPITVSVLKDTVGQIDRVSALARSAAAEIVSFHRESWKAEVRRKVMTKPNLEVPAPGKQEETIRAIKKEFGLVMQGKPYYPELINEIFAENTAPDPSASQARLLAALVVPEAEREEPKKKLPTKPLLIDAARILSRTSSELTVALATLVENYRSLQSRGLRLGERIRRWLLARLGQQEIEDVYEVEYYEAMATAPKVERVNFPRFVEDARRKTRLLSALGGSATAFQKLEQASEERLFAFVARQLDELHLIHRRMGSLNSFFQNKASRDRKATAKGIRLELVAIKNGIVKASQKRQEYVARKEEQEQLERLGSTTSY